MTTRCKYYVSAINTTANANGDGKAWCKVCLNAVYSQDKGTENHAFWSASPNGTMWFNCPAEEVDKWKPGSFWYIDCTPADPHHVVADDPDVFVMTMLDRSNGGFKVKLTKGYQACFEVSIDNKNVWPVYMNQVDSLFTLKFTETVK